MKSKRDIFVATALSVALVGGGFAIGREAQKRDAQANDALVASRTPNGSLPSFADLASRVAPAVVNIKATSITKTDFPDQLFGENFPFPGFRRKCPGDHGYIERQGAI